MCERIACGSSLKFCRLAEGQADLYPRLGPTRQWDIAAGHAVLLAAGGIVTTPGGGPLMLSASERSRRAGLHRLGRSIGAGAARPLRSSGRQRALDDRPLLVGSGDQARSYPA